MRNKSLMEDYILTKRKVGNIFNSINPLKKFNLNEGLITTYPIEKLYKHAKEYCNFASFTEEYNSGNYQGVIKIIDGCNETKCIQTIFHKSDYNQQLIDNMFNTYGYFKSNTMELLNNYISIEYESKYDKVFKQQLLNRKYLYHLTTQNKADKILKEGIKAHKGNEGFNYPRRIYLFTNEYNDDFLKEFFNEKIERSNKFQVAKFYKISLTLLKIDITGIINKAKFHYDPNMENGVYTEDYIPSNVISLVRNINYKILKKGDGTVIERR